MTIKKPFEFNGSRESVEVAAEELSTPLEVKVYYINSIKIYFTAPQQQKTNIVEDESSETSACTVREEIEVTIMLQLFSMYDNLSSHI